MNRGKHLGQLKQRQDPVASQYGYQAASVITAPAQDAFVIVQSDTQTYSQQGFPPVARAIYVGSGGHIVCITAGGTQVTFFNCQTGSILPVATQQVLNNNTSATQLVGLV